MSQIRRACLSAAALGGMCLSTGSAFSDDTAAKIDGPIVNTSPVVFSRDVRPLLERHCIKCHGPDKHQGGYRLDNKADAFRPGESGEASIIAREPERSAVWTRLRSIDDFERMPQKAEALPDVEIRLIERWIREGATWPDDGAAASIGQRELKVTASDRDHWAFRPLAHVVPPAAPPGGWGSSPIDRFIAEKLVTAGLEPARPLERGPEVRRLSFDLIGLPPAPELVEAYCSDASNTAHATLVEKLLADRGFGEHWARLWLDAARYADSDGYERDGDRPDAWRYRDFVIRAFNSDLPFDDFVHWQVAGDELSPDNPEALIATGFLALGPHAETQVTDLPENREKVRYDNLDDVLSTVGAAFLGLTVGCARCHDHKYDAIPTRDYYSLLSAFTNLDRGQWPTSRSHRERERLLARERAAWRERKFDELSVPEWDREMLRVRLNANNGTQKASWEKWGKSLEISEEDLRRTLPAEVQSRLQRLDEACAAAASQGAERALAVVEQSQPAGTNWLLSRGDPQRKQEAVSLGFLQVLTREKSAADYWSESRGERESGENLSTGQRSALAAWLTDPVHGAGALTARVIVNRLWQRHFGHGLVRTPNDFGVQGDAPSHPELLEWLAGELVSSGWRLKHVHRLILNSATYRQRTSLTPQDRLLAGRRPVRLDAEALRDSLLAVSGDLQANTGGPGFKPPIPAEAMATRSADRYPDRVTDGPPVWRRSIFLFIKRSVRFPFAEVFDAPDSTASCGQRIRTTVPTQQLALLNDEFARARARAFAVRLEREESATEARLRRGFHLALGREPTAAELADSIELLARASLVDWCHALFLLNEFTYVD